jgi:uncharacterized membrane protein
MQLEALFIGIKEAVKLSLCIILFNSYLGVSKRQYLKAPFYLAILIVLCLSSATLFFSVTPAMRNIVVKMTGYVFGIFYILSIGALYHETGTDLLGPLKNVLNRRTVISLTIFVLTCLYFAPDMLGSTLYVSDLFAMSGNAPFTIALPVLGFIFFLTIFFMVIRKKQFVINKMIGIPQLLLFFALIKLFAGGIRGFTELSLIVSVQNGLMKLIHDVVHQTLVTLLVPDHPLLKTTTWNFIGIIFSETVTLWLSVIIFLIPLFIFVRKYYVSAIYIPSDLPTPASKRKFIKSVKDERLLRSLPIVIFMVCILGTWFVEKGESISKLYDPEPIPAVSDGGKIVIPLSSPRSDLRDGMLHKYSVNIAGDSVRIMIMKKEDESLAVCLDACEICPPDGYVQGEGHVVCLYCMTPISIESLGEQGGCNPIPLDALITEKNIEIDLLEVQEKWNKVKTGKIKEVTQ